MNLNMKVLRLEKSGIQYLRLVLFVLINLLITGTANAQTKRSVSGSVTSNGESLIGVSIVEVGTSNGTVTDMDGKFSLKVGENATLNFSYVGYKDTKIQVGSKNTLNVHMQENVNMLDEVVAIGYGIQKKKLVTGATVQIKGDDISKMNTVNAMTALQSQMPGVNITKVSGKPGDGFKVLIRGIGTTGDSRPLYIIDGVPAGNEDNVMNDLNPADIESVDVLKDAATAAIYGSRAANGVILITTKQGKKGKATIMYDGYFGWQNVYKNLDPLNAKQYMEIIDEAKGIKNGFLNSMSEYDRESYESGAWTGTNWLKEIERKNAPVTNHTLNISGGNDVSIYSIGLGYTSEAPIIGVNNGEIEPRYERYNARFNSEHTLVKHKGFDLLQFGQTLSLVYKNNSAMSMATGSKDWNDVRNALTANPLYQVYKEDGESFNTAGWNGSGENNPVAQMYYNSFTASKNYSARGSFYLVLQPIKNLRYRGSFGYNYSGWSSRQYKPVYYLNIESNTNSRNLQGSGNGIGSWTFDNTLTYDFKLADAHNISAMIGMSVERSGFGENMNGTTYDSQFNDFEHAYLSNGRFTDSKLIGISGTPWDQGSRASFFGRVNYDYKGKYMATVIARRDGSSKFARGHRWSTFPSVSAGWVISSESFMQETVSWLDFLKLRASWGQNGNDQIRNFAYAGNFILSGESVSYPFGSDKSSSLVGAYQGNMANSSIMWETSEQLNIGLDAWLLKSRLGVNFDFYRKATKNWLVKPPMLGSVGTGPAWINGGDVLNQGVELMLTWQDKIGDFNYRITPNFTYNKNEVRRIENDRGIIDGTTGVLSHQTGVLSRAQQGGFPIGYFYGYKANGIIQTPAEAETYDRTHIMSESGVALKSQPGDVKYVDVNKDGYIDENDMTMIGDPNPDFTFGVSVSLDWKGLDFSITGTGVAGNQIAQSYRSFMNMTNQNYTSDILGRWTGEGTSDRLPRLTPGSLNRNWSRISDQLFIEDGDYFRISNITIGYNFNRLIKKSSPFSLLRVYVTAQNVATFTGYSGMDPEVGYGGTDAWAKGIDLGTYPVPRTFLVGVSIKY